MLTRRTDRQANAKGRWPILRWVTPVRARKRRTAWPKGVHFGLSLSLAQPDVKGAFATIGCVAASS